VGRASEAGSFYGVDLSQKWIAKNFNIQANLYRSIQAGRSCFPRIKNHPAETIGRLNQKFFGRRVETMFSSPWPPSRVFSENL
jgi:hypothetical protein